MAVSAVEPAGRSLIVARISLSSAQPYEAQKDAALTNRNPRRSRGICPSPQIGTAVVELSMSPGAPNRPPLAMKFWLFRQVSGTGTSAGGQSADRIMSIESLEHIVRSRLRTVLRHTWLVAILGTAVVIGAAWAAFYFTTESEHLRVAATPADAKFIEALSEQIAQGRHDLRLKLVPAADPQQAADAVKDGKAERSGKPRCLDPELLCSQRVQERGPNRPQ